MAEHGVELEEMRAFVGVADSGSILRAAESLKTSRSRVRRLLDQLETSLGLTLVGRKRDGVELTEAGEEFLPHARQVLGQVRSLVSHMRERQPEPLGVIRIGLQVGYPCDIALRMSRLVFRHFRRLHVEFVIAERPVDLLPEKAQVVLCLGEQRPPVPCEELKMGTVLQQLMGSRSFIEKAGPFVDLDDVLPHLFGTWRGPDGGGDVLHLSGGRTTRVRVPVRTSDEVFLARAARLGAGLVYAPLPALKAGADDEDLVPVLRGTVGRELSAYLMAPQLMARTPRFQFLIDALRALMVGMRH